MSDSPVVCGFSVKQEIHGWNGQLLRQMMLAKLFNIRPNQHEELDAYMQRRRTLTQHFARDQGRWGELWKKSLFSWEAHLHRAHDEGSWSPRIFRYKGSAWLAPQRALFSRVGESKLGLRARHGRPALRWDEALETIRGIV